MSQIINGIVYTITDQYAIVGGDSTKQNNAIADETAIYKTKRIKLESHVNGYIVLKIGSQAFSNSNIEYIWIPNTVEVLQFDCLAYIDTLKTVIFEKDSHLTTLEQGVFHKSKNIEILSLPERIQSISQFALGGTNIKTLYYYGMFTIDEQRIFSYDTQYEHPSSFPKEVLTCESSTFDHFGEYSNIKKILKCPKAEITKILNNNVDRSDFYLFTCSVIILPFFK